MFEHHLKLRMIIIHIGYHVPCVDWIDLSTTHIVQCVLTDRVVSVDWIDLSTTHIVQCVLTDRVLSVDWIDLSTTHIVQCVLTDRVVLYTEVPLRLLQLREEHG